MPRKQLIENIRQLDGKLSLEQSLLKLNGRERVAYLRSLSPWILIGAGAAGGIALGLLGSSGRSRLVSASMTGMHLWRLKSLASTLTGGGEAEVADAVATGGDIV
ncbi:hypothetical protein [uncultured Halopseudomonas sp.]|uniref:hypothetical protein n=1 Tax=uncultured Halopseudomonas sp. TaxID=2901193 RepID=UPI0030EE4273